MVTRLQGDRKSLLTFNLAHAGKLCLHTPTLGLVRVNKAQTHIELVLVGGGV